MRIAVARERIEGERRVAISPEAAKALVAAGHDLIIEAGAGLAAGMHDAQYESVGASIAPDRA
ncbi:MAG TPA: NAD(P)(+) transhydrogenase (Re/Si-specific) subunit alpha, partial [Acidimicrobiaceae bacterium]|nr:NAD(P)(+) transhydrogenase (Re/Si-specific) subunit alpha [Acidimicrobiaceae bacterium]